MRYDRVYIKALQTASAIEYPEHIADVLYLGGCDFRCPYCYNVDLVLHSDAMPDLDLGQVLGKLAGRRRLIDGVVISGGEPTLQPGLLELMGSIKDLQLHVKLDTNGYHPEIVRRAVNCGVVDYIAMDVKGDLNHYERVAGVAAETGRLRESIAVILESGLDHEFRTTIVPGFVSEDDVAMIAGEIRGARRYFLQGFRATRTIAWSERPPMVPSKNLMMAMAKRAALYVQEVGLRIES